MAEPERIDRRRAALIAYDVCRRALTPSDPARSAAMRPVLDAWVRMIAAARAAGVPVIYTTPVSRSDGADIVMLPTERVDQLQGGAFFVGLVLDKGEEARFVKPVAGDCGQRDREPDDHEPARSLSRPQESHYGGMSAHQSASRFGAAKRLGR